MKHRRLGVALVTAVVAGVALGRFFFLDLAGAREPGAPAAPPRGDVAAAVAAVAAAPEDPAALARLGAAYLAEARRTADPALYGRADDAITRSLAADGGAGQPSTLVTAGLLALARHDFTGALAHATEARRLAPLAVDPLGVEVDALVELGRYDEASVVVDEMVRRRPDVASLSRASYVLELAGERDAALDAMQQAVAAGVAGTEDRAYVLTLLGDLLLGRGRIDAADAAYERALADAATLPQASLGRARVLVARGDLAAAADRLQELTERIPLPDAVALHGDVLTAAGDESGAAAQYELVRTIEQLNAAAGGVAVDLELARFEASQIGRPGGDAERAVSLARAARAARPTIFADDILAWSLRKAGRPSEALPLARAAVRTGVADSTIWWHLAAVEADLGLDDDARTHLRQALELNPFLPVLERAEADALAKRLGVARP